MEGGAIEGYVAMTIKQTRQSLGMSVTDFADAIGVSANTVRRWEMNPARTGHRTPSEQSRRLIEQLAAQGRGQ